MKNDHIDVMPRDFVFRYPGFPLGVKKITQQNPYNYHVHEGYCELVVISRGHATHIFDGMKYSIGPGDVFVIQEGRVHAYADVRDIELINILFDWKKLNMPLYDLDTCTGFQFLFKIDPQSTMKDRFDHRFRLNASQLAMTMELINSLEQAIDDALPGYQFKAITLFQQLILNLVMNYSHMEAEGGRNTIPHLIGALIGSMEKDCSQSFSVDEMCRKTNMSRANLFRHFKKYFRETPLNYLQNIRIEHASQLLINSDLNINEIAGQSGFADSTYFARRFRAATGYAPGEFRKNFTRGY